MIEWKEYKFSETLVNESISYGVVQPGSHKNDGVPIVRVNNIKKGCILIDEVMRVDPSIEQKYRKTRLEGGELLITLVGSVGECAIVPDSLKGWNVARAVSVARIKPNFDKRFIKYCFQLEEIKHQLYGNTNDTVQPTLNLSSLKDIILKCPSAPEQKAIAEVLTSLDDKIDLLHKQNKTLEQLAETLFRHHFIDNAQDDWEEGNVTDEFSLTMGQSPSGNSFNEEGFGIPMFQGNADFEFRFPKKRIYTTEPKKFAEKYDTLISVRAPVGEQNMASERCCIGRGVAAFRYKNEQNFYSYTYFKMKSLMEEIKQFNQTGTVFGSISKTDFESLKITIPSFDEVSSFQEKIFPIDSKIITNCDQIKSLEKLRDQLLPRLMSGEIRIN